MENNKKLVSLEIENEPCVLTFTLDEKINFYGLLVKGVFDDGS